MLWWAVILVVGCCVGLGSLLLSPLPLPWVMAALTPPPPPSVVVRLPHLLFLQWWFASALLPSVVVCNHSPLAAVPSHPTLRLGLRPFLSFGRFFASLPNRESTSLLPLLAARLPSPPAVARPAFGWGGGSGVGVSGVGSRSGPKGAERKARPGPQGKVRAHPIQQEGRRKARDQNI